MPWELGFFDGAVGRVGIWSVPDPEVKNFPGQEYLALYERVTPSNLGEFLKRNAGFGAPGLAHPRAIDAGAATLNRMPQLTVSDPFQAWLEWSSYWTGVWQRVVQK
jgi:hypothetical protein